MKGDVRCIDCPNLGFCNSVPWRCGWMAISNTNINLRTGEPLKKPRRDWKGIKARHAAERRKKEEADRNKDPFGQLRRGSLFYRGNPYCNEEDTRG